MADKGRSEKDFFGNGYTHYDSNGKKIGRSEPNIFGGGYTNYDVNGKKVGRTEQNFFGGGCYVATCVYGSYDCPEVWTLRRFRDNTLAKSVFGRAFIRTYYAVSPTIVKIFGNTKWFRAMWKKPLDKMVSGLHEKGIENTPYDDVKW